MTTNATGYWVIIWARAKTLTPRDDSTAGHILIRGGGSGKARQRLVQSTAW
jgi:hypothetical protein